MILAEITTVDLWTPLIQGGIGALLLGPIVYWFAMRFERIVERNTAAVERITIALMVAVLNTKHLDEALRPLAEQQKRDAEDNQKKARV